MEMSQVGQMEKSFFWKDGEAQTNSQAFFSPSSLKAEAETEAIIIYGSDPVSPQTLSHLKCRPADRGGATDTKLSSFFLEFV